MPLYDNAEYLIRANLNEIAEGRQNQTQTTGKIKAAISGLSATKKTLARIT